MKLKATRKWGAAALATIMSATLVAPGAALGANSSSSGLNANWEVPNTPMTNTVNIDGKDKKVITTWQNAWATSGADYLGISNCYILNGAGSAGNTGITNNLTDAQNSTMLGAWASSANEVPNAYNWNSFYQFYVDVKGQGLDGGSAAPFTAIYSTQFDSESGVFSPFKYRPELVSPGGSADRLSDDDAATAVKQIKAGQYYQDDTTYTNETVDTDVSVTTETQVVDGGNGYDDALASARTAFANGKYKAYAASASYAFKSSAHRTETYSTTEVTEDQYKALLGDAKEVKDAAYDEASASDDLKAIYAKATSKITEADAAKVTGATYTLSSAANRGTTTYTVAFDLTFSDYTTTFTFSFKTSTDTSKYYVSGDEKYDPYFFGWNNASPFTFLDSFHKVAEAAEQVIKDTASNKGTETDWKGMNSLPRTTRYEAVGLSAEDCATNVEKSVRGSIYYTLSKIADKTTNKKTVALLTGSPSADSSTATIILYDYVDTIGQGSDAGYAGAAPLVINQLGTEDYVKGSGSQYEWKLASSVVPGSGESSMSALATYKVSNNSTMTIRTAEVSADYLASADVIECLNGSFTAAQMKAWMQEKCTSDANKAKADSIQYLTNPGAVMSSANYTSEKLLNTLFLINFTYPELFPNLELLAYWYDEIYHVKTESVAQSLQWGFATATRPKDTELADLADGYKLSNIEAKFAAGYDYYAAELAKGVKSSDETIARLCANKGLDGNTSFTNTDGKTVDYVFENWKASDGYKAWAAAYKKANSSTSKKSQSITVSSTVKKSYKVSKLKKAKKTFKIGAKAKTTPTYTVTKKDAKKKVTVSKKGVVTVKKGTKKGSYTVKVKVTAPASTKYKKATKNITVKVTVKK